MTPQPIPPIDPKDWLINQSPKLKDGLLLRARAKRGKSSDLTATLPSSAYYGIAKSLSNSEIDFEPDRF